jgi:hypothetical protein
MQALNNNVKFYENYFHASKEIFNPQTTAKEKAWAALKTVSLATLILPIIFGVGYLIAKVKLENATKLCDRVTKMLENQGKTSEKIENHQPAQASQQDLVEYLVIKLQDGEADKNKFATVFKKLEPEFQGKFFAAAAEKEK